MKDTFNQFFFYTFYETDKFNLNLKLNQMAVAYYPLLYNTKN
jgi:hypothetical protein